jgi:hypothetical protein
MARMAELATFLIRVFGSWSRNEYRHGPSQYYLFSELLKSQANLDGKLALFLPWRLHSSCFTKLQRPPKSLSDILQLTNASASCL